MIFSITYIAHISPRSNLDPCVCLYTNGVIHIQVYYTQVFTWYEKDVTLLHTRSFPRQSDVPVVKLGRYTDNLYAVFPHTSLMVFILKGHLHVRSPMEINPLWPSGPIWWYVSALKLASVIYHEFEHHIFEITAIFTRDQCFKLNK